MKKSMVVLLTVVFMLAVAAAAIAEFKGKMEVKAGDEIYVCACGEKCPCDTMSMNPGKCTCGKEMVKATVTKVEKGMVYVDGGGKKAYKQTGKFMCACGAECKCNTVSQNPGKCSCGKEMKKVSKK